MFIYTINLYFYKFIYVSFTQTHYNNDTWWKNVLNNDFLHKNILLQLYYCNFYQNSILLDFQILLVFRLYNHFKSRIFK